MTTVSGRPPGRMQAQTVPGLHRRDVRPSILALLERLPQTAGFVLSAAFEVLAWNGLAAALMEDFAELAPKDRNLARRAFLGPARADATLYGISDAAEFRHHAVVELRSTLARYPSDPAVTEHDDRLAPQEVCAVVLAETTGQRPSLEAQSR
ncbi:hypothetical protein [Nonomuraea sp. B19D2]|uniref:MmyB family transcriptional regulator n=1 Tax=Nonomuraea sp. B19D2 TaxID=3159561 RepID=UPI0032DB90FD